MEANKEKTIKQLNDLVEINNDRIAGYEKAAAETKDNELLPLFRDMAAHSRSYKNDLSAQVRSLGGEPTEGTRTSGKIFRAWMDIKAALTASDQKEILKSCERGEDAALEAYYDALKSDAPFTEEMRRIITQQQQELQKDHDRVKKLRDSVLVK
jgi:uncharacterized protein (TIGR02284 family)